MVAFLERDMHVPTWAHKVSRLFPEWDPFYEGACLVVRALLFFSYFKGTFARRDHERVPGLVDHYW